MSLEKPTELKERRCYSMKNVIDQTPIDGMDVQSIHNSLLNSPFAKSLVAKKHDASTDAIAAIVELSSIVLEASTPNLIGRQLVRIIETTAASVKIRRKGLGKAVDTKRGAKGASRGGRHSYSTLTPDDEMEASDRWDRTFLEDAEYDVAREEAADIGVAHDIIETEKIIKFLDDIPANQLAGGALVQAVTANTFTYDDIVNLWTQITERDETPNTLVLNPAQYADLLKEEDFKDSLIFGDYLDIKNGKYGGLILGVQILVSSLMKAGTVFMMDTSKTAFYCIRRDKVINGFQPTMNLFELQVSTRYALDKGVPAAFSKMSNA